ncbi:hypothetical protein L2E82_04340 [Cichorium intybus]|uniref:Uncharacterized protein n=1 Tax=Cichorium intybus TaxID=13427 RepID=A0ACB9H4X3_CICIN|nr:hypothetical protein L2E82_04340 [Cichorium intybus]
MPRQNRFSDTTFSTDDISQIKVIFDFKVVRYADFRLLHHQAFLLRQKHSVAWRSSKISSSSIVICKVIFSASHFSIRFLHSEPQIPCYLFTIVFILTDESKQFTRSKAHTAFNRAKVELKI